MPLFNLFKAKSADPAPNQASFTQPASKSGLVVTGELDKALEECKAAVARIAKECRTKNRRFRDIEFDLENDEYACLNGLVGLPDESYSPADTRRVGQIFDNPQFFVDGANSNDIMQGQVGDCWFLSALATMATAEGLVEKFCVARDEEIGVYGFIFFKDDHWVSVIIDDLLYTAIPKYEELNSSEKALYHNDKELYNKSARKGSQTLYFAKSGTDGETWVPLIEKAYAKLHGDYASLSGGYACEAIEDLTGGVSSFIQSKDIFDIDKFWTEELMKANKDRLFGCYFEPLDGTRSGDPSAKIFGLIGNHAYSVLRAVEAKGKRFVVIRNPWGNSEWTGPWSDGSKEWTAEWLEILPTLGHVFGDDGEFVMEYSDFLDCWDQIDRTLLFDSNWITSSHWLRVSARELPSAWTYGDVCFTITVPKSSFTIIVLSQLDSRYFKDISGRSYWTFDFLLFKRGQSEPVATSSQPRFYSRSVNLELELEAGDYVVHVRLDRMVRADRPKNYFNDNSGNWDQRKLSRVLTMRAQSQSIASNFKAETQSKNLIIPVEAVAGLNFADMEKKAIEKAEAQKKEAEAAALLANPPKVVTTTTTTTTTVTTIAADGTKTVTTNDVITEKPVENAASAPSDPAPAADSIPTIDPTATAEVKAADPAPAVVSPFPPAAATPEPDVSEDDTIFMGLRVYTDKEGGAATIGGQLRHEMEAAFANLGVKAN
ncbi:Cysteine proteinase [Mycena sanguinolenta]|uniref:Cysteine proteinase n=1 Tax=Mycena sanguinolenta TaxID=230812 RepID=A0A8H7DH64_9AGAR|nr:Cysteine proteinase [Mycena sanguinolenta]